MRELVQQIGADELLYWRAYYELDPWGGERADAQAALICSVLHNAWRGKNEPAADVKDYMPDYFGERESRQPVIDLREMSLAEVREFAREHSRRLNEGG